MEKLFFTFIATNFYVATTCSETLEISVVSSPSIATVSDAI